LKLLLGVCDFPIYHFGEFQEVWRHHSPRPNYLGFQASRRVHHSMEEVRYTGLERDLGDSDTWVFLAIT
jgi:hypothetical protein